MSDRPDDLTAPGGPQTQPDAAEGHGLPPSERTHLPDRMPLDEAIRTAAAEVRKAAEMVVRSFREDAAERLKRLRDSPTGDLVGDLLKLVEKYPGQGVLVAILVGFFLGRTFRK